LPRSDRDFWLRAGNPGWLVCQQRRCLPRQGRPRSVGWATQAEV